MTLLGLELRLTA